MSQGRLCANFTTCPFWANCQKALPLWGSIRKNLSFSHTDPVLPEPRPPEAPWPQQPPTGDHRPTGRPVGRLPLGLQYHLYSRASCSFIVQLNPSVYLPIYLSIHPSIHPSIYPPHHLFICHLPIWSIIYHLSILYGLLVFLKYNSWTIFSMLDTFRQKTTSHFSLKCLNCFQRIQIACKLTFFCRGWGERENNL